MIRRCSAGLAAYPLIDAHHIFVHCPSIQHLRDDYSELLISEIERALTDSH
jgi:hypothetical protein